MNLYCVEELTTSGKSYKNRRFSYEGKQVEYVVAMRSFSAAAFLSTRKSVRKRAVKRRIVVFGEKGTWD